MVTSTKGKLGYSKRLSFYCLDYNVSQNLFNFEVNAESWVAVAESDAGTPARDTTLEKVQTGCLKLPVDVSLDASNSATFTSTKSHGDISAYTGITSGWPSKGILSLWFYCDCALTNITTIELRLGSDSSNYIAFYLDKTQLSEDTWHYFCLDLEGAYKLNPSACIGTPNWEACDYTALKVTYAVAQTDFNLYIDDMNLTAGKNYGTRCKSCKITKQVNGEDVIDATFYAVAQSDSYMAKKKHCLVLVGEKLLSKGVLSQPEYLTNKMCKVKAYGSTGCDGTYPFRQLSDEVCASSENTGVTSNVVLSTYIAPSGTITIDSVNSGGSNRVNFNTAYENRLKTLNKFCETTMQEWWPEYEPNVTIPVASTLEAIFANDTLTLPYKNDELHVTLTSSHGSDVSATTTFATSGSGANARLIANQEDEDSHVNRAVILGSGKGISQMVSDIYNAASEYSTLTSALDTYLVVDASKNDTKFYGTHDQSETQMPTGADFYVWLNNTHVNVQYAGTVFSVKSGQSLAKSAKAGTDVLFWRENTSASASSLNVELVSTSGDTILLPSNTTQVRIGSEIFGVGAYTTAATISTLNTCVRNTAGTMLAHGNDINVWLYDDGSGPYTPTAPKANSDIAGGLKEKSYTNRDATKENDLDMQGQDLVLGRTGGLNRIQVIPSDPYDTLDTKDIELGDLVSVVDSNAGLASPTKYRVTGIELNYDIPISRLTLNLAKQVGKYGKQVYSQELSEGVGVDIQRPVRDYANEMSNYLAPQSDGDLNISSGGGGDININADDDTYLNATDNVIVQSDGGQIYLCGDDNSTLYVDVQGDKGSNRTYSAYLRVYGAEAANEYDYISMGHDGTDGSIDSNRGQLIIDAEETILIRANDDVNDYLAMSTINNNCMIEKIGGDQLIIDSSGTLTLNADDTMQLQAANDIMIYGDNVGIGLGDHSGSYIFTVYDDNDAAMFAVDSDGNGSTNGDFDVGGTLSKGSGTFKIDHPLDPKNKILRHSLVEAPEMLNIYRGSDCVDEGGLNIGDRLPEYFWVLNKDISVQLTPCEKALVWYEVNENQRMIILHADKPVRVSWYVFGVRNDRFAQAHPLIVESDKEKPYYIHPKLFS